MSNGSGVKATHDGMWYVGTNADLAMHDDVPRGVGTSSGGLGVLSKAETCRQDPPEMETENMEMAMNVSFILYLSRTHVT